MVHFDVCRKIPVDLGIYDNATIGNAIGIKTKNYEILVS